MTSKKRKYGNLSERPLPTEDESLVDDVFAAFTRRPNTAPSNIEAPSKSKGQPLQIEAASNIEAPPKFEAASGFLRVSNEMLDNILPTLRPSEQVILLRLYRLSRGFSKSTCTVSIGTLASRCHLKPSQTRSCLKELERRGLIRRLGVDLANPVQDLRGVTFDVLVGGIASSKSGGGVKFEAPSKSEPNKLKALKENTHTQVQPPEAAGVGVGSRFSLKQCIVYAEHRKASDPNMRSAEAVGRKLYETGREDELIDEWLAAKVAPQLDTSQCPDCHGTGMYYPEGLGKGGVKKCAHEKLK
jgi:DNA-binding Lrp family transcriptional regulator